ncbi:hypothetical protein POVWA1_029500 [Plasmodium ovale wallikeri]|uniref:Uncharacterized protein n=1 Tax=Plasmodium ovale wallikeri TaxID=864142 RepID=A0A1A8YWL0_PLAOA|nr:hypothetical protein POVWA1_029500 [Plasmodium ovale wallikeri]
MSTLDGCEKGGCEKDGSEKGGSEKGGSEKGGSEKGGSEKGGSEKGGSEKGGSEKRGSEKGAATSSDESSDSYYKNKFRFKKNSIEIKKKSLLKNRLKNDDIQEIIKNDPILSNINKGLECDGEVFCLANVRDGKLRERDLGNETGERDQGNETGERDGGNEAGEKKVKTKTITSDTSTGTQNHVMISNKGKKDSNVNFLKDSHTQKKDLMIGGDIGDVEQGQGGCYINSKGKREKQEGGEILKYDDMSKITTTMQSDKRKIKKNLQVCDKMEGKNSSKDTLKGKQNCEKGEGESIVGSFMSPPLYEKKKKKKKEEEEEEKEKEKKEKEKEKKEKEKEKEKKEKEKKEKEKAELSPLSLIKKHGKMINRIQEVHTSNGQEVENLRNDFTIIKNDLTQIMNLINISQKAVSSLK